MFKTVHYVLFNVLVAKKSIMVSMKRYKQYWTLKVKMVAKNIWSILNLSGVIYRYVQYIILNNVGVKILLYTSLWSLMIFGKFDLKIQNGR